MSRLRVLYIYFLGLVCMSLTWTHTLTRNCNNSAPPSQSPPSAFNLLALSPLSTNRRSFTSAMGVVRRRRHYHRNHRLLTALAFLLFASASAVSLTPPRHRGKNSKTQQTHLTQSRFFPHGFPGTGGLVGQEREERKRGSGSVALEPVLTQKRLGGPGSSPPTCRSKCGRCTPCKAVHVPIQPGFSIPLEYYPEAWRCKCGNKLFMP